MEGNGPGAERPVPHRDPPSLHRFYASRRTRGSGNHGTMPAYRLRDVSRVCRHRAVGPLPRSKREGVPIASVRRKYRLHKRRSSGSWQVAGPHARPATNFGLDQAHRPQPGSGLSQSARNSESHGAGGSNAAAVPTGPPASRRRPMRATFCIHSPCSAVAPAAAD